MFSMYTIVTFFEKVIRLESDDDVKFLQNLEKIDDRYLLICFSVQFCNCWILNMRKQEVFNCFLQMDWKKEQKYVSIMWHPSALLLSL